MGFINYFINIDKFNHFYKNIYRDFKKDIILIKLNATLIHDFVVCAIQHFTICNLHLGVQFGRPPNVPSNIRKGL